ncbi:MAG: iron ABC transporter permease [Gilvibacter sp.]
MRSKIHNQLLLLLLVATVIVFVINLSLGSVVIPFKDTLASLFGQETSQASTNFIVTQYRLPKAFMAVMVGAGLSAAGLLMQTLFRNPLAGPFVLGITSGASLGVAILILGAGAIGGVLSTYLTNPYSIVIASGIGSFLVLLAVLGVTKKLKDTMAILIIGLMFGSVTGAVVSVLAYFSPAQELQQYIFWSFGSLGGTSWQGVILVALCFFVGIVLCIRAIKPLNAMLLGDAYAQSLGLNLTKHRMAIIFATCVLAGSITAFAGPIAFIGLAVPHVARQLFWTNNHAILLPAVLLCGAIVMLSCDIFAQLPGSEFTLPINAVTSLFGAPIVIWLLIKKGKLLF